MKEPLILALTVGFLVLSGVLGAFPAVRRLFRQEHAAHRRRSVGFEAVLYGALFAGGQIGVLGREVWALALSGALLVGLTWFFARMRFGLRNET